MKITFFSTALIASTLFFACKKKDITESLLTPEPHPAYYAAATIDSTSWEADTLTGPVSMGLLFDIHQFPPIDSANVNYFTLFDGITLPGEPGPGHLAIGYSGLRHKISTYNSSESAFTNAMTVLSPTYYVDSSSVPGFEILYIDNNWQRWSSKLGPQTGAAFTLESNTPGYTENFMYPLRRIKGTFSCKVYYELDTTQFKTITGGAFYVYLRKADI